MLIVALIVSSPGRVEAPCIKAESLPQRLFDSTILIKAEGSLHYEVSARKLLHLVAKFTVFIFLNASTNIFINLCESASLK